MIDLLCIMVPCNVAAHLTAETLGRSAKASSCDTQQSDCSPLGCALLMCMWSRGDKIFNLSLHIKFVRIVVCMQQVLLNQSSRSLADTLSQACH